MTATPAAGALDVWIYEENWRAYLGVSPGQYARYVGPERYRRIDAEGVIELAVQINALFESLAAQTPQEKPNS